MSKTTESMIDVRHAAYLTRLSPSTILRLIDRGELPAKLFRNKYRMYPSDVKIIAEKYRIQAQEHLERTRGKCDIPANRTITIDSYIETHGIARKYKDRQNVSNTAVNC